MVKRIFAFLLTLSTIISLVPTNAFAIGVNNQDLSEDVGSFCAAYSPEAGVITVSGIPDGAIVVVAGYTAGQMTYTHFLDTQADLASYALPQDIEIDTAKVFCLDENYCPLYSEQELIIVKYIPVTGVEILPGALTLNVEEIGILSAVMQPANATNAGVTWQSSAPEIVSVDEYGILEAHTTGSAVITATTEEGEYTASCDVTVVEKLSAEIDADKSFCLTGDVISWNITTANGGTNPEYAYRIYCNGVLVEKTEETTSASYEYIAEDPGSYFATAIVSDETGAAQYAASSRTTVAPASIGAVQLTANCQTLTVGQELVVSANVSAAETAGLEYQFVFSNNGQPLLTTPYQNSNTYTYVPTVRSKNLTVSVSVRDDQGNFVTSEDISVNVNGISISTEINHLTTEISLGEPIILDVSSVGGYGKIKYVYSLSYEGKTVVKTEATESTQFTYIPQNEGEYRLTITDSDEAGSLGSAVSDVVTVTPPEISIEGISLSSNTVTVGEVVTIEPIVKCISPNAQYFYHIFKGDYWGESVQVDTVTGSSSFEYVFDVPGTYYFSVEISQGNYGYRADSSAITVLEAALPVIETVSVSQKSAVTDEPVTCFVYAYGGTGILQYAYDVYLDDILLNSGEWSYRNTFVLTPASTGSYSVLCRVKDERDQSVSAESEVISVVDDLQIAAFSSDLSSVVSGTDVQFTAAVTGGMAPFTYEYEFFADGVLLDTIRCISNQLSYTMNVSGNYTVSLTVEDSIGHIAKSCIENIHVEEALADFYLIAPTEGEMYDMVSSLNVSCTEVENTDTYWFTLTDLTTQTEITSIGKTKASGSIPKRNFMPGHQYSVFATACDADENVLAISDPVVFSTDPYALGTTIDILFPTDPENTSSIPDTDLVEVNMGSSYIIVEPVANAEWYYVKYTPKYDSHISMTTEKTAEPFILVPTGLTDGGDYKITVYAGNSTTSVSASLSYITVYAEDAFSKALYFSNSGGTQQLSTSASSLGWTAACDGDWVSVSPASGTGAQTVTVTVSPNTTGKFRICYMQLTHNSEGIGWYAIVQSAYEGLEIKPLPAISGWNNSDISLFCEKVDGTINNLGFSGSVSGGDGVLDYARIAIVDAATKQEYTFYKETASGNEINLSSAGRISMAQRYTDAQGNVFDASAPGTFDIRIYAKNQGGNEACIASRRLYLSRDIYSYEIHPDNTNANLEDKVTWTFDYTGGGDGMRFQFMLYLNGVKVETGAASSKNYASFYLDENGKYTVRVLVDYGDAVELFRDDKNSAILLSDNSATYSDPYISSVNVSETSAAVGDEVTWRVSAKDGLRPYSYKYVIYCNGSQYKYVGYDEGAGNSYTLALTKAGTYTAKIYVKDAYGTEAMEECEAVTVVSSSTSSGNVLRITAPTSGETVKYGNLQLKWSAYPYGFEYYLVTVLDLTDNKVVYESKHTDENYGLSAGCFTEGHTYKFVLGVYNVQESSLRETSVVFYVEGESGSEGSEETETPPVIETGLVQITYPVNGQSIVHEDFTIQWNDFENADSYYLALRDLTAYPGNWDTTAAEYVYNGFVAGNALLIEAGKLTSGHSYRLWMEARNADGNTIATRTVNFSIVAEVELPIPVITFDASDQTISLETPYSFSGTISANGGTLDMIWITVNEIGTGKQCDYAIYDSNAIAALGSADSFDLRNVASIPTGAGTYIGTSGSGYAGSTSQSLYLDTPGSGYLMEIRARNAGDNTLYLLAEQIITLRAADYLRISDGAGNDLNGKTITLDYNETFSGYVYMDSNMDTVAAWDGEPFKLVHDVGEPFQYEDGIRYVMRLDTGENPYATQRKSIFYFYELVNGTPDKSKVWATLTIVQKGNPYVPSNVYLKNGDEIFNQKNPVKLGPCTSNYPNGYPLVVEVGTDEDICWTPYISDTSIATVYQDQGKIYITTTGKTGTTSLFISRIYTRNPETLTEKQRVKVCDIIVGSNSWDFSAYDISNVNNAGLAQLAGTSLNSYLYQDNPGQLWIDAISQTFSKYSDLAKEQVLNFAKGNIIPSGDYIAQLYYKEALAKIIGSIGTPDPRYNTTILEDIVKANDLGTEQIITYLENTRKAILTYTGNLMIDTDISEPLKQIDKINNCLTILKSANKTAKAFSFGLNIVTYYSLFNFDASTNLVILKNYRNALVHNIDFLENKESPNSNLLTAVDTLIKEYSDMKKTANEFLNTVISSDVIDAVLGLWAPTSIVDTVMTGTGLVLKFAGLADDADARMLSVYSENTVYSAILGGLAPVEQKIAYGQADTITEAELSAYMIFARYAYASKLVAIEALLKSGAANSSEAIELRAMKTRLERGLKSIENKKIGVI